MSDFQPNFQSEDNDTDVVESLHITGVTLISDLKWSENVQYQFCTNMAFVDRVTVRVAGEEWRRTSNETKSLPEGA